MATVASRRTTGVTARAPRTPRWLIAMVIVYALLLVFSFIALSPFVFAVLSAFKTADKVLE